MAFAYGFGHGAGFGFGLAFLNLVGTILFIALVVFVVRSIVRGGWRNGRGPWHGGTDWGAGWHGGPGRRWAGHDGPAIDEAMQTARERLAGGEIGPQEFETLKRGLGTGSAEEQPRRDSAVNRARVRFAKGELSLEEFEAVKKALQS